MQQTFVCTNKNEDLNGFHINLQLDNGTTAASAAGVQYGQLNFTQASETFASTFKPGKKYTLNLTEVKEAIK